MLGNLPSRSFAWDDIRAIIDSIKAEFRTGAMREELETLEAGKREL
jgi:hypothetical protein